MTEQYVQDLVTPCKPADLYAAIRAAWPSIIDGDAAFTRAAAVLIVAHWGLETGWGHSCHCWNLGNAKYTVGCGHDYTMFPCSEVIGGVNVNFSPPDPQCRFLAFGSLGEGTCYYLTQLRGRWRSAWPALIAGDAAGYAHALKLARYYTAPEDRYTRTLVDCMAEADKLIPADTEPPPPAEDTGPHPSLDDPHSDPGPEAA